MKNYPFVVYAMVAFSCLLFLISCEQIVSNADDVGNPTTTTSTTIDSSSTTSSTTTTTTIAKKVLILIANNGFYYQEYADPRTALEARGIQVTVAAGSMALATPHPNTGQPGGIDGNTQPDIAVSAVEVDDFDGLVIAGGWGASHYYFAHPGTILAPWAPIPARASEVNQLIVDFLNAGKYVMGVCNGVNVLSWARLNGQVGGQSPLNGKTVSAPYLNVPPQNYLGVDYDDDPGTASIPGLPMWNFADDNGATVRAKDSVGNPASDADDVSVADLVITVQDNFAAYEGGTVLANLLLF